MNTYQIDTHSLTPRKRLQNLGPQSLKDLELLELILGKGIEPTVPRQIQGLLDTGKLNLENLLKIQGVGFSSAARMLAVVEFSRRTAVKPHTKVNQPADLVPLLMHYAIRPQEVFGVVLLNGAQEILKIIPVTQGLINRVLIHPRECFAPAIEARATSVIIFHNHPSGAGVDPSREDREATTRLSQAGKLLGIELLDHIIVSPTGGFYSFRENGDVFI